MPAWENEVILIESDSDTPPAADADLLPRSPPAPVPPRGTSGPSPTKRSPPPGPLSEPKKSKLATRPFAGESSSESEQPLKEASQSSPKLEYLSDSSSETSSSESAVAPIVQQDIASRDNTSRQIVLETRQFLKQFGTVEFVKHYLPRTASCADIERVIDQLGFIPNPAREEIDQDSRILALVKILQTVLKKVLRMRTRLTHVFSAEHAVEKIKEANKILIITGAGISTSLGIPDFRSSKGFYSKLESLGLNDPQEVFDLTFFRMDPTVFYSIAHMILPPEGQFTPLHAFIKLLQAKNKLLRNYTQNIDNLESNAGIDKDKIVQCHGSFATASCVTCQYKVDGSALRADIMAKEVSYCPKCAPRRKRLVDKDVYVEESYGVMKPDITFFGEKLPDRFHDLIKQDLQECDLLISVGTSLQVSPVADIVRLIPESVPQILINRDTIPDCNFDVTMLGYCDDIACYLADQLGWVIEHPDFHKIVGDGSNLELLTLNLYNGLHSIKNRSLPQ